MDNQTVKELKQLSITLTHILDNLYKVQSVFPYNDKYKTGKTSLHILERDILFDNNIVNEMLIKQKQIDETAIVNLIFEISENELIEQYNKKYSQVF